MKLQNGYKLVYGKNNAGKMDVYGSKTGIPAEGDIKFDIEAARDAKLVYGKKVGDVYGIYASADQFPSDDDVRLDQVSDELFAEGEKVEVKKVYFDFEVVLNVAAAIDTNYHSLTNFPEDGEYEVGYDFRVAGVLPEIFGQIALEPAGVANLISDGWYFDEECTLAFEGKVLEDMNGTAELPLKVYIKLNQHEGDVEEGEIV